MAGTLEAYWIQSFWFFFGENLQPSVEKFHNAVYFQRKKILKVYESDFNC